VLVLIYSLGTVIMDEDLGAQLPLDKQSEMVKHFHELAASYHSKSSVRAKALNPLVIWQQYTLARRLNAIIKNHIKRKFAELKEASTNEKRSRSVLALSLQNIEQLDAHVLDETCDQLKTFLFAGHDTTSILLQWTFYELSRTPRVLESIRRELDDVFGPDPSPAVVRDKLLAPNGGELLTKLQYTSAVIKEILRLYPSSGTARLVPQGSGAYIQLPDGRSLCIDGVLMYNCETLIHRDETAYGESKDDFVPERWLGDAGADSIPSTAWRPFERGPRSCIGQGLSTIEAQVILACAVRRYEFVKIGLGEVARDSAGKPILDPRGQYEVKSKLFNVSLPVFFSDLSTALTFNLDDASDCKACRWNDDEGEVVLR
jgi:cytochrome P450